MQDLFSLAANSVSQLADFLTARNSEPDMSKEL